MKRLLKIVLISTILMLSIYYGGGYYLNCKIPNRDIKMGVSMCMDFMNQFPIKYFK